MPEVLLTNYIDALNQTRPSQTEDKMTGKLGDAKAAVADFTGKFDDTFNDFVSSFVKAALVIASAGAFRV